MKRRLSVQKSMNATGGIVDGCPPCRRCGGQLRCDRRADFDPLKPEFRDWHESWECYEFDHDGKTFEAFFVRCDSCSRTSNYWQEKPLTNTPIQETIET
jgi:hypothetical protein